MNYLNNAIAFGSTFAFFANTQTNAKNAKELPSQRTTTRQQKTKWTDKKRAIG